MRRLGILGWLYLSLAGCSMSQPLNDAALNPPAQSCGAEQLQGLIGQPQAVLNAMTFSQPMRIVPPGARVTMDFVPNRVNVATDGQGVITFVSCG